MRERDDGAHKVRDWYSRAEVQDLYATFATSAVLSGLRDAYTSFVRSEIVPEEELVLLELGIGPGHQFERLLTSAKAWPLAGLKIIGVDLCQSYLDEAAARIERLAKALPFPVVFHGRVASFTDLLWPQLPWQPHLIASTLALHHLRWDQKEAFFQQVTGANARAFFIGEVDRSLDRRPGEPDHGRREGRRLYESVFRVVAEEAGLTPEVAAEVTRSFFAPELASVTSRQYALRGEYYLSQEDWRRFLAGAGFPRTEVRETFRSRDGGYRLVAVTGSGKASNHLSGGGFDEAL